MKRRSRFTRILVAVLAASLPLAAWADYYAARNGTNSNLAPYTSWATAASNIQAAVNAAMNRATVWVGAGTYTLPPNPTNFASANNVVYINKPLTLRGATGNPGDVKINGQGANRGIAATYATMGTLTLSGITASNGYVNSGAGTAYGAGLHVVPGGNWTSVIDHCVFVGNTITGATAYGGGVYIGAVNHMYFMISHCRLSRNRAEGTGARGGGAMFNAGNSFYTAGGTIVDSSFEENFSYYGGGADCKDVGQRQYRFTNCTFRANRAHHSGGGMHHWPAGVRMWNCLVANNAAIGHSFPNGGGIYTEKTSTNGLYLYNCTIVSNRSTYLGGALQARQDSDHIRMYNTIVYSNSPANREICLYGTNVVLRSVFDHSCFRTNNIHRTAGTGPTTFGPGNVTNAHPQFVNMPARDYRIRATSPCLNAGTNLTWMSQALDLDGNPRVDRASEVVDMGCYEIPFVNGTFIMIK